jgi:hypothetical protein
VITVAIFDKKGFQMIDTVHTSVVCQTKWRKTFDRAARKPSKKEVDITNTQNLYNLIMGFVDLDDLLTWFYRCNGHREVKFWVPLYIWVIRKRADQAYKDYRLRWNADLAELERKLAAPRLAARNKAALQAEKQALYRKEVSHFDFLEAVCGYHIIMAYNSRHEPADHLTSPTQWRTAIAGGPLTNAKTKRASQRKKARTNAAGAASSSVPAGDPAQAQRRVRGGKYSKDPDGDVPWPASRMWNAGKHNVGTPGSNNYCDYPRCPSLRRLDFGTPQQPAAAATTPLGRGLTARPVLPPGSRKRAVDPRAPSPAGSDSSTASDTIRASRCKICCLNCFDPAGKRPMNFHEECWNKWHGLCE